MKFVLWLPIAVPVVALLLGSTPLVCAKKSVAAPFGTRADDARFRQKLLMAVEETRARRSASEGFIPEEAEAHETGGWSLESRSRNRERKAETVFIEAFAVIIHFMSPGWDPQSSTDYNKYYAAGAGRYDDNGVYHYNASEPLRLFDLSEPQSPVWWRYTDQRELQMMGDDIVDNPDDIGRPYAEFKKLKNNAPIYLTEKDIYSVEQLWSSDSDRSVWMGGEVFPTKRRFCVTADTDNGAIRTGNELHLSKCRIGGKKDRIQDSQQWAFCYTENVCKDDVDPPDYYIEKRCKDDSEYELFCDDTSRRYSTNDGDDISDDFYDDINNSGCGGSFSDRDSLLFELDADDKDDDEDVLVTLDSDCTDDVDIELRIFEYDSDKEEYQCIDVDETRCDDNDEEAQVFARSSDNRFLVIATKKSSTSDDTDFRLETECDSRRRQLDGRGQSGGAKGRKLQVRKALECGDEEKDKVTDGGRNPPRGVFNDESCQTDVKNKNNQVVDEDRLANTYYSVEVTDDDTSIRIESTCNGDGRDERLSTLFRLYKVNGGDINESGTDYDCVDSFTLKCDANGRPSDEFSRGSLEDGEKFIVRATGEESSCELSDFECV